MQTRDAGRKRVMACAEGGYVGRFAPSPTGPLHLGSAAAALASYLDARAHTGCWLLRIEDLDTPRAVTGAAEFIQGQLRFLGMNWQDPVMFQSRRSCRYQQAFDHLAAAGRVFGCACTRREIADSLPAPGGEPGLRHRDPIYPGTCRFGIPGGRPPRSWRFLVEDGPVAFDDRWLGPQHQEPAVDTGDFVIRRADGLWAYQLAVTVDDGDSGVTDVVRGQDILGSTGRQIQLQRALDLPAPAYLHIPLALGTDGEKLSKQNGAGSITGAEPSHPSRRPCDLLDQAATVLRMQPPATRDLESWLTQATQQWALRFPG